MKIRPFMLTASLVSLLVLFFGCKGTYDIQFENTLINFGEVMEGQEVPVTYVFRNTGTATIKLTDIKFGCGCTTAANWDREVKPGESGKIPVLFQSAGFPGKVIKVIDVITNIPQMPSIQLTLQGNVVIPPIIAAPAVLWLAEVSRNYKEMVGTIYIKNGTGAPVAITEVIPPAGIRSEHKLTRLEGKSSMGYDFQLDFTVYPPYEGKGAMQKNFILKTDYKEQPEVVAAFSYSITD